MTWGRWLSALAGARTPEVVALCATSLRAHTGRYAPLLTKHGEATKREAAFALTEGFYHAAAFGSKRARRA